MSDGALRASGEGAESVAQYYLLRPPRQGVPPLREGVSTLAGAAGSSCRLSSSGTWWSLAKRDSDQPMLLCLRIRVRRWRALAPAARSTHADYHMLSQPHSVDMGVCWASAWHFTLKSRGPSPDSTDAASTSG